MDTATCCATVIGRAHRLQGRGNQDAGVVGAGPGCAVAVVADGCSSGRHSEIGAGVGARVLAAAAVRRAAAGASLEELPALVLADWTAELARLAQAMSPTEDLRAAAHDALLSTALVALSRGEDAVVFGVGDGVVIVDGVVSVIDQGEAPDYPAYALFAELPAPRLVIHHRGPFARVVIGTDGAAPHTGKIVAALEDPRVLTNKSLLQKRLNVAARGPMPPEDDCTIAVLARATPRGAPCA